MLTVVFQIGTQAYGIAADCVDEVVLRPALVMPTGDDPAVCGLLNLHGRYLPVLDGGLLFGTAPVADLNSHLLILGGGRPELALLVPQVTDVITLEPAQVAPLGPGSATALLRRIADADGEAVLLTELAALRERLTNTVAEELPV